MLSGLRSRRESGTPGMGVGIDIMRIRIEDMIAAMSVETLTLTEDDAMAAELGRSTNPCVVRLPSRVAVGRMRIVAPVGMPPLTARGQTIEAGQGVDMPVKAEAVKTEETRHVVRQSAA